MRPKVAEGRQAAVWLILLAVALGLLSGYWLGALYGVVLAVVFVGVVVAIEERSRRRSGVADRSAHFDENKQQFVNYTDRHGVDVPTALSDTPSSVPAAPGTKIGEGDQAP